MLWLDVEISRVSFCMGWLAPNCKGSWKKTHIHVCAEFSMTILPCATGTSLNAILYLWLMVDMGLKDSLLAPARHMPRKVEALR